LPLLELRKVTKNFGRLQAVADLDFEVEKGEIHSLIGPNGAGKTTVFNLITGTFPVSSGQIFFDGREITNLPPHDIAQKGITRSFQQTFLFMQSTVLENVMTGFHMRSRVGPFREFLHSSSARRADREATEKALEILDLMGLTPVRNEFAANLPHGFQKALGVSIALACDPVLLLLDEPVTGMNPTETAEMVERIRRIRERGITIVIVEHDMKVVMGISDRTTVLNYGRKIAACLPHEIRNNREVVEAYLGKEEL
jgi:branched-chain amino acid transport system ATP-binding protein